MSYFLLLAGLTAQMTGGSDCGFPTGRYLRQVAVSYIFLNDSGLAEEKTDTLKNGPHFQVYATSLGDWIRYDGKCYLLAWRNLEKTDTCHTTVLSDTVLTLVVSDDPPCGKVQKDFLVAEKFYWLNSKKKYVEWEPGADFKETKFKLYKESSFYYIAYRGYCWQANEVGDRFEVQFGGDTVGVFIRVKQ